MDERPPHASIAVNERVDALELRVGQGSLSDWRQHIVITEGTEVREQPGERPRAAAARTPPSRD